MKEMLKISATVAVEAPAGSPFPVINPDIYRSADWLAANGFDAIEVHIRAPQVVDGPRLADHCAQKGLGISSIGTGLAAGYEKLFLTSTDKTVAKNAVQRIKEQLDLSRVFGRCPVIIGSMRGNKAPDESFAAFDARMVDAMRELAAYAEKVECPLVIEAIDRFETNYLRTADEVLALIDRVGSPYVQVHLDTFHMNLEESSWSAPVRACKGRLGHVHVADNRREYPKPGLVDFKLFIKTLYEIGYENTLTLECYPTPDSTTALLQGSGYLRRIMGELLAQNSL